MALARGAILTDRDRVLLTFVGVARYVSADQVHRLFFEGSSKKQTYRRLSKLCEPGAKPGEGPCLRRLEYRRREGTAVPVWALAPWGRVVASKAYPFLRPPASSDIGHQFLEHTLMLNEVLTSLVLALRESAAAPFADLPFEWLSEDDETLQFEWSSIDRKGDQFKAVLKPDAILEGKLVRRRLFLEAETGTQSIVTSHPGRSGAIVSKVRRYVRFIGGFRPGTRQTFYSAAFDDTLQARLVFLVHSDERKVRVERALKEEFRDGFADGFGIIVLTFDEAAAALASYLLRGRLEATPVIEKPRVIAFDAARAHVLRESIRSIVRAMRESQRMAHQAPGLATTADSLRALRTLNDFVVQDLGGQQIE